MAGGTSMSGGGEAAASASASPTAGVAMATEKPAASAAAPSNRTTDTGLEAAAAQVGGGNDGRPPERRVTRNQLRRTKIVCTIGPATDTYEQIKALADVGMDVVRMNFSHGTHDYHKRVSDIVDRLNEERFEKARRRWLSQESQAGAATGAEGESRPPPSSSAASFSGSSDSLNSIGVAGDHKSDAKSALFVKIAKMLDSKGAEVRSGEMTRAKQLADQMVQCGMVSADAAHEALQNEAIVLAQGTRILLRCTHEAFTAQPEPERETAAGGDSTAAVVVVPVLGVSYPGFFKDVDVGDPVLVDGGLLEFVVESKREQTHDLVCRVVDGGEMTARRHLNVRGKTVSLPSVTESDWKDIEFGVTELNVDYIALSFVNDAETVFRVRQFVERLGSRAWIISKIESVKGVKNLPEILDASDGVMVARGDLGSELPLEEVPIVQSFMVRQCRGAGKVCITATEMLESMIEKPIPTRAEASDVAHAVEQGADAVMLSGESAKGKYPIRACATMRHIVTRQNEQLVADERAHQGLDPHVEFAACCRDPERVVEAMARAAVSLAECLDAAAIIVFTRTGNMPKRLSALRSRVPIVAATSVTDLQSKLSLLWNVACVTVEMQGTFEATFARFVEEILAENFLRKGDTVVVVQSGTRGIWRNEGHHLLRYVTL
ncbi:hypothetical protein CDCA_CDCA12G3431 [Cyanidium caldarium]|uniref:pyruvate kinase n=1 Tax=Cyanidium caldarium TaxID=2771 RepID=A0AAV9IZ64_CYACA|nr:hypothetical protein CDCA_CDCA12G3431 [Cyanidium caldarium]